MKSKAEKTREFIIGKAAPLFNKKGYAGTSLSDLLDATKLTKGSLYGNFENKDDIAIAAFEHNFNWLKNGFISAVNSTQNSVDKLMAMIQFSRREYLKLSNMGGCPLLNTAIEADDNMPLLQKKVRAAISSWKKLIETVIEEGKSRNEIKKDVDAAKYSSLIIALTEGGTMLAKISGDPAQLFIALDAAEKIVREELKK